MASFFAELKRRNVFNVGMAYAIVAWLIAQIVFVFDAPLNPPGWFDTVVAVLLIICFPLALLFAWSYELTPEGIKISKLVTCEDNIWVVTKDAFSQLLFLILPKLAVCLCTLTLLLGCVMEPVLGEGDEIRVELSVGDTVRILTKDSQRRTFRVTAFEPDVLVGEDGGDSIRVPYEDIVFLERRRVSRGLTAVTAAGVVTSALFIITLDGLVVFSGVGP